MLTQEVELARTTHGGLQATLDPRRTTLKQLSRIGGTHEVGRPEVLLLVKILNGEIARTAKSPKDLSKLDHNTRMNGKVAMDVAAAIKAWVGSALFG